MPSLLVRVIPVIEAVKLKYYSTASSRYVQYLEHVGMREFRAIFANGATNDS
jgi:hypothetical protein